MPALFDPNDAKSTEAKNLWYLAEALAACPQFLELNELDLDDPDSEDAAFEKITIGPFKDRAEDETYTPEELASDFLFCAISPPDDDSHEALKPETLTECPNEGGRFEIYIRRHVRTGEIQEGDDGKRDVYLFFLDRLAAIQHQLHEQANANSAPRILSVRRVMGPHFADLAQEVAQGCYIWASLMVEWGDLDQAGGGR
jgi:hypothetical protein